MTENKPFDINSRSFEFAVTVLDASDLIPSGRIGNRIADQLIRSSTSIGANLEEATGASSKPDFINKVIIALKEARETNYWLRLSQRKRLIPIELLNPLLAESEEIKKILGSIATKARKNSKR
jgi:four helix bundle protein